MKAVHTLLLAVTCTLATPVYACGSGSASAVPALGANYGSPTSQLVLQLNAADANAIAAAHQRIANLDKAIAIAKVADVLIGAAASSVPYGGAAYNAGKTIVYVVVGDTTEANKSAVHGLLGMMGPTSEGAKTTSLFLDVANALSVGQEFNEAFGW